MVSNDHAATVGKTPMVELARLARGLPARLAAKLEMRNPCGSVKDRLGVALIDRAEKAGDLPKGMTLIEPTGGNTGVGLAFAAAIRGYRLILTMPALMLDQFRNPANPDIHRKTTALEIWDDTAGEVDCFVCAVGTGGTITGVGEVLKERKPAVRIVAVEPAGQRCSRAERRVHIRCPASA